MNNIIKRGFILSLAVVATVFLTDVKVNADEVIEAGAGFDGTELTVEDYLFDGETPFGVDDMSQFLNGIQPNNNDTESWNLYKEGVLDKIIDDTETEQPAESQKSTVNNASKKVTDKKNKKIDEYKNDKGKLNKPVDEDVVKANKDETQNSISENTISDNHVKESKGNEIKEDKNGVNKVLDKLNDDNKWQLILVNKQNYVPDDYEADLVYVNGGMQVRKEVATPLARMLKAASEDGVSLMICSAYRSYERQTELFNRKLNKLMGSGMSYLEAYRKGSYSVTIPGTSEHQLGMALDIVSGSYTTLDEGFGNTKAGKWLKNNAPEYGFILRYPENKEHVTGITYEPWHFRYVGVEFSKDITDSGLSLEEYLEENGVR